MGRYLLVFTLLGAFVFTGCNDSRKCPGSSRETATPKLPPEYRTLAQNLLMEMKSSPGQFQDNLGISQILAGGKGAILALQNIKSSDPEINFIADQGQTTYSDALRHMERLNSLPKPPGSGELLVSSFIDGLRFNFVGAYNRNKDADNRQKTIIAEVEGLIRAMDKVDMVQSLFTKVAEKFAPPADSDDGRIIVDVNQSWGSFGPHDWLCLHNQGRELEDCTIQVELTGIQGETRKNVHFLPKWPADSWMYARYAPGYDLLGRKVGCMTVFDINTVVVKVFSPRYSTKINYVYQGAEKDKDVAQWCKNLKFQGHYRPFASGLIKNTQRGVYFTLEGVSFIPKCGVDVTFRRGAESKGLHWQFDGWKQGEEKTFGTKKGQVTFDPDNIDMVISFPGTSYQHKTTLALKQ